MDGTMSRLQRVEYLCGRENEDENDGFRHDGAGCKGGGKTFQTFGNCAEG